MKTYKLFMLTLVVALSMFTTGCTESDELTEIIPATEQKEEPTDSTESTSDEFSQALEAIPGVYNVQVDEVKEGDNEEARRYYTFFFNQLIDHNNPSLGYFKQQVRIRISRKGLTAPVVLFTNGYGMSEVNNSYASEMTDYLDASTLWIEHRYFNNSQPEPFESLEFTYLNADQAAQDLHAIVSVMKQTVFKQSGKWVSTGISKDGITTALYAYYSDIYGWDDIDLYMPFCAPFLEATTESCNDPKVGQYLYNVCGSGYPADSQEDIAYQRIRQIPLALIQNKELRDACLRLYHQKDPSEYVEIINTFGRDEEMVTAGVLYLFFSFLFDKFSYVPFNTWASMVPDTSDVERMSEFIMMNSDELEHINDGGNTYGFDYTYEPSANEPKAMSDDELLLFRSSEPDMPYFVQAVRELGNIRLDFSSLDGLHFPGSTSDFGFLAATISHQFEMSVVFQRYSHQWDGGQLMKSFRQWVKTQNKYNMIFAYSYNDPWTAGAIDASINPKVKRIICKNGTHNDYFLNPKYYTEEEKQLLLGWVHDFIGL